MLALRVPGRPGAIHQRVILSRRSHSRSVACHSPVTAHHGTVRPGPAEWQVSAAPTAHAGKRVAMYIGGGLLVLILIIILLVLVF